MTTSILLYFVFFFTAQPYDISILPLNMETVFRRNITNRKDVHVC